MKSIMLPYLTGFDTDTIKRLRSRKYGCFSYNRIDTHCSPMECDLYMHKNNATYFTDLDVSRGDLMCKIFQQLFLGSKQWPYIPVANVFTTYFRDIKPFERYSVTSRILCWDEKWIYVLSEFTKPCSSSNSANISKSGIERDLKRDNETLCSLSLTKYVLKNGRITISPVDAFTSCGLYNDDMVETNSKNYEILIKECGFHNTEPLEKMRFDYSERI